MPRETASPLLAVQSPKDGQVVAPGNDIEVKLVKLPGPATGEVSVLSLGDPSVVPVTALPATVRIKVPQDATGKFSIVILAKDASGAMAQPIKRTLEVVPSASLQSLWVTPSRVTLPWPPGPGSAQTRSLVVFGHYSDGVQREVQSAEATTYTSNNPRIVTVPSPGQLRAMGVGTATVLVRNAGIAVTVPVTVEATSDAAGVPVGRSRAGESPESSCPVGTGQGTLVIVPSLNGAPMDPRLDVSALVVLDASRETPDGGHVTTGKPQRITTRLKDRVITVPGVAAGLFYSPAVAIDTNPANGFGARWGMPGDLTGHADEVARVCDGETARLNARMEHLVRLLEPEDTGREIERPKGELPTFRSPLRITWEPVPGATGYDVALRHRRETRYRTEMVTVPTWTVDLAPTEPGDFYELKIDVRGTKRWERIGHLEGSSADTRALMYRFEVTK